MRADDDASQVPDIVLERYRLDEVSSEERADLHERIGTSATLAARVQALEESDADLARQYPPHRLAADIRRRIVDRGHPAAAMPGPRAYWVTATALAALVVLLVVAVPRSMNRLAGSRASTGASGDRVKGPSAALSLYRRTADGSETLADGAIARPGDLVRLAYRPAGRAYGVILSIDGRGAVTIHLPPDGRRAAPLKSQATVLLDQAYELDDAPNWERFYFITGHTAFDVGPVVEAARRAAAAEPRTPPRALALPGGLDQTTFSLQKEARP